MKRYVGIAFLVCALSACTLNKEELALRKQKENIDLYFQIGLYSGSLEPDPEFQDTSRSFDFKFIAGEGATLSVTYRDTIDNYADAMDDAFDQRLISPSVTGKVSFFVQKTPTEINFQALGPGNEKIMSEHQKYFESVIRRIYKKQMKDLEELDKFLEPRQRLYNV